ncbi:hypothetical protein MKQ68_23775 [Chitinophaga horti]|uniref:Succinate dehydrogenase n=1 Tax=Chitinophaga horti TaxID=2920382 RepID=A0ABY6J0F1_9BACT|nr:hypothetical protein [Chitinophaga horti]UYQ93105.1 hypothetical protein MKQ68_23775 [Chitinophaga horti]
MKTMISNSRWPLWLGIILTLPAGWLILMTVLKYGMGYSFLSDWSGPAAESMGLVTYGLGFNLWVILAPTLAVIINVLSFTHCEYTFYQHFISMRFMVRKNWWNMAVAANGMLILGMVFIYLLGENGWRFMFLFE